MNKAGVLRKAIEVIHKLQNDNARLKQENIALKMEQQKRGAFLSKLIELIFKYTTSFYEINLNLMSV